MHAWTSVRVSSFSPFRKQHRSWELRNLFSFLPFFYRKYWLNLTLSIWHVQVIINEYLTCNNSLIIKPDEVLIWLSCMRWSDRTDVISPTGSLLPVQPTFCCRSNLLHAACCTAHQSDCLITSICLPRPRKTQLEGALESISTLLHLIVSTKYNYNTPLLTSKLKSKPRLDP